MTDYATSTMFVPKHYQMDPATEDLLGDSTDLAPGMMVLVAYDHLRMHVGDPIDGQNYNRAMRYNRWFTIVSATFRHTQTHGTVTEIVGEYEDGVKMKLDSLSLQTPWYVKKITLPEGPVDHSAIDVEVKGCRVFGAHRKPKVGAMANYGWFLVGMTAAVLTAGTGIFYLWWQIAMELAPSCQ
jgi:hypothetical protein